MNKESLSKLLAMAGDEEFCALANDIDDALDVKNRIVSGSVPDPEGKDARSVALKEQITPGIFEKIAAAKDGIGLILNGGGAKGCYQIGAASAIREHTGISFSGYSGTSAGALNVALLSTDNLDRAKKLWSGILSNNLLSLNDVLMPGPENDIVLERLLNDSGVLDEIGPDSPLSFVTAFDVNSGYPKDFLLNISDHGRKKKALMASSAFPVAFYSQSMDGSEYVDGGMPVFGDNMPITPLYLLGFRRFVVLHTQSHEEARHNALLEQLRASVNKQEYYNGALFVHIYPSHDMGDTLDGTMNFTPEYIAKGMELGYRDALAASGDLSHLSDSLPGGYEERHYVAGNVFRSYKELIS